MAAITSLDPQILLHIAQILNLPLQGVRAIMALLDEGSTVPFIARYRKEATGNLDEVQIRDTEEKLAYFRELVARRETIHHPCCGLLAEATRTGAADDHLYAWNGRHDRHPSQFSSASRSHVDTHGR